MFPQFFRTPFSQVDMQMQGPTTGACSGAAFQNDGNDITIADSNESPPERFEKRRFDAC